MGRSPDIRNWQLHPYWKIENLSKAGSSVSIIFVKSFPRRVSASTSRSVPRWALFLFGSIFQVHFLVRVFLYLSNLIKNYLTTFPDGTQKRQQFHNYDGSQKSKQVPPSSPSFISPWRIESMFEQFRGTISSPNYVTTIATTTTWRVTGKNSH